MGGNRRFGLVAMMIVAVGIVATGVVRAETVELGQIGRPVEQVEVVGPETRIKVSLPGAKDNVKVVRLGDGTVAYVVKRLGSGTDRVLTPEEFSEFLYRSRERDGWMESVFNITSPVGLIWVGLGLLGQVVFTARMIVQWMASERERRSVVPVAFWWMSLIGASMLLIYFIWRRDIVGVLGQATGWFIYVRNLVLIRRTRG